MVRAMQTSMPPILGCGGGARGGVGARAERRLWRARPGRLITLGDDGGQLQAPNVETRSSQTGTAATVDRQGAEEQSLLGESSARSHGEAVTGATTAVRPRVRWTRSS